MKELLFLISDYLKGKPTYPTIRRLFSLLFLVCITSFIFEKFYFTYNLIELTDYQEMIKFFTQGRFLIPLSIFTCMHLTFEFMPQILLYLLTKKKYNSITNTLYALKLSKQDYSVCLGYFYKLPFVKIPAELKNKNITDLCLSIKSSVSDKDFESLTEIAEDGKTAVKANITLVIKAIVLITICFCSIPYFGVTLFVIVLALLLISIVVLYYAYIFLDILPAAARRFHFYAMAYLTMND